MDISVETMDMLSETSAPSPAVESHGADSLGGDPLTDPLSDSSDVGDVQMAVNTGKF